MYFVTIILILTLLVIAYYDFKYMAVPWILLLASVIVAFIRIFMVTTSSEALTFLITNLSGVGLLLTLSILILFIFKRRIFNPINTLIGVGDLLFFPVVCVIFSPLNFILFIILSLAMLLVIKPLWFRKNRSMPLVGGLALVSILFIVTGYVTGYNLFDDTVLIKILVP